MRAARDETKPSVAHHVLQQLLRRGARTKGVDPRPHRSLDGRAVPKEGGIAQETESKNLLPKNSLLLLARRFLLLSRLARLSLGGGPLEHDVAGLLAIDLQHAVSARRLGHGARAPGVHHVPTGRSDLALGCSVGVALV